MSTPRHVPSTPFTLTDRRFRAQSHRADLRPSLLLARPGRPWGCVPCPDAGFAFVLARLLAPDFELEPSEHIEDAITATGTIGLCIAGLRGRAPTIHDARAAATLLGLQPSGTGSGTGGWRTKHLGGIRHDPELRRALQTASLPIAAELVAGGTPPERSLRAAFVEQSDPATPESGRSDIT